MKCSICNGTLKYENGLYVCESCGRTQQISSVFQNEEVFIAYIENDDLGRRTQDSIVAQDIFNKLQVEGINTFYERISAADLIGNNYNKAIEIASNSAKIVFFVGCSNENFKKLTDIYSYIFGKKTIIPVYSQMNAFGLPHEISSLQAVNYDTVGSVTDIIKNVLKLLGKSQNVDVISKAKQEKSIKKKIMLCSLGVICIAFAAICSYLVFGTHYVLDSKKYEYAQKLEYIGNYTEALKVYADIADYKDATNRIDAIYDKYNGYFYNNNDEFTLYLNIDKNTNSKIEITRRYNGEYISIQTEATVQENVINFECKDSMNNRGNGKIELLNTGLKITIISDEKDSIEYDFSFTDKSDVPQINSISSKDLIGWMNNRLTLQEINKMGFRTEFIVDLCPVDISQNVYKIENTNYGILVSDTEQNSESIVGVYIPYEELFQDEKCSYIPMVSGNNVYLHCKTYVANIQNLSYELSKQGTDFPENTYFVTSKDVLNEFWDNVFDTENKDKFWEELKKEVVEFCNYNETVGIKYHLEKIPDDGTNTVMGNYEYLCDAIKEANNSENLAVVDNSGTLVYIP